MRTTLNGGTVSCATPPALTASVPFTTSKSESAAQPCALSVVVAPCVAPRHPVSVSDRAYALQPTAFRLLTVTVSAPLRARAPRARPCQLGAAPGVSGACQSAGAGTPEGGGAQ